MDNNNNNSGFVPNNDTDDDCTFLQTLLEMDPQHFYLPTEEFDSLSQQQQQKNDPFGVEKGNKVSFLQGNNNNDFPIGEGVVPDVVDVEEEEGPPRGAGKELIPEGQGDRFFIHGDDIFFFGEGGVGNNVDPPQENQTQPPNNQDVRSLCPWPPPPEPFSCSCCEVLRQINYTNGVRFDKLEIHGTVGVINHAICHVEDKTSNRPPRDTYQIIDFCNKNTEEIRNFLNVYCKERIEAGFIPIEDPSMSAFYDALCTGMDWTEVSNDVDDDLGPPNGTEQESESEPEAGNGRRASTSRPRRRDMAVQRQRVPRMTLSDLSGVFHLTISAAAVKLDVSNSTVKSICRRGKLKRWPQRKVQSLAKKVRVLVRALNSPDPGVKRRTQDEIRRLQKEIIENCGGITPTGIPMLQFDEE
ncbi:hypothetical protein AAZV13_06G180200 [Glycine max]|uniref:RWP-RK domain-containing protein n=2 Tax=Glycine subgen. Soja TaxID=1462606 RepID=K7KW17_SOYBN|nr:uncharacterized protein LOC100784971 isoform X1 [Glycine max]|eukprot:XP_014632063.1 uncharacterized protein LOC100784971 [Glycine max]